MYSDVTYRVLKILEEEPTITQRQLAERLGVSLGKANYCLNALIRKGFVKSRNFKNSQRKIQYVYVLTPRGARERLRAAFEFMRHKSDEFEELREEINRLKTRVRNL